jgi:hypothetical protein
MLYVMRNVKVFSLVSFTLALGCNQEGSKGGVSPYVQSVQLTAAGTLKIKGKTAGIEKLEIRSYSGDKVPLEILSQGDESAEAGALSVLRLVPGAIYDLVISSAQASQVVPIQVEGTASIAAGAPGPAGPQGPQGPVGPFGQGASIVIKDGSRTVGYFLHAADAPDSGDNINSVAMILLAKTGQMVEIDLFSGKVAESNAGRIYYSGLNCSGATYQNYTSNSAFPVLGRVIRTKSDNRYFEVTGFVTSATVASHREYTTMGRHGICENEATTLGNAFLGKGALTLRSTVAPESLEPFAPFRLQLE